MLEVIQFGIDDTFELMLLLIQLQLMLVPSCVAVNQAKAVVVVAVVCFRHWEDINRLSEKELIQSDRSNKETIFRWKKSLKAVQVEMPSMNREHAFKRVICRTYPDAVKRWDHHLLFSIWPFPLSYSLCSSFQYSWYWVNKFANDWMRTADLLCRKRTPYQLRHNHCPIYYLIYVIFWREIIWVLEIGKELACKTGFESYSVILVS